MRKSDMIILENEKYFSYEMIGEFRSNGKWIHPDRVISTYELIFVLHGKVYITEDNISYEICENEMIILEPGKRHYGTKETSEFVSFYWFHFDTNMPVKGKKIVLNDIYDVKYFLKKLLHMTNSNENIKECKDALGLCIYNECTKIQNLSYRNITLATEIKEFIRNNIKKNITVHEIAAHFGYNPDYIGKLFHSSFNISLKKYINLQRLNSAKDLLITTSMSLKQIAYEIGYTDENLFIKFFMYHEKMSPSVFRNRYFNTHINHN